MSTAENVSISPAEGWHCSHLYYRFDRARLRELSPENLRAGREAFVATLSTGESAESTAPATTGGAAAAGCAVESGFSRISAV